MIEAAPRGVWAEVAFAAYDPHRGAALDDLLARARRDADFVRA